MNSNQMGDRFAPQDLTPESIELLLQALDLLTKVVRDDDPSRSEPEYLERKRRVTQILLKVAPASAAVW